MGSTAPTGFRSRRNRRRASISRSRSAWIARPNSKFNMPRSVTRVLAGTCHEYSKRSAWPLVVPTLERPAVIRLFFSCSSVVRVVQSADHRPVRIAGSVVARHPAGGSTRRRSMVSMSGGPSRASGRPYDRTPGWATRRPWSRGMDIRPVLDHRLQAGTGPVQVRRNGGSCETEPWR